MMRGARLAVFLTVLAVRPAFAAPVVFFGDSWAADGAVPLQDALTAAGFGALTVANSGTGGTTARQYAVTDPTAILTALAANADAEWLYLSLGGNDVFDHYLNNNPGTSAAANDANLRVILNNVFSAYPDLRVVLTGYAYTNFEQSPACQAEAVMFFGAGVTQAQINAILLAEVGAVLQRLADAYPNVTYLPVWDVFQRDAGQTPDATAPSPASYMQDCLHPTVAGYRVAMDDVVTRYWSAATPPTAAFVDDGAPRCVDEPIVFSDRSTGASRIRWAVDGLHAGVGGSVTVTARALGSFTVQLTAFEGPWADVEQVVVPIGTCLDAGVPDTGIVDVGFPVDAAPPDAGVVDVGPTDTGVPPFDSGVLPFDSGVIRDATVVPPADAGPVGSDAGPESSVWGLGGGCSAGGPGDPSGWVWLLGLLAGWRWRRGRSRSV